MRDKTIRYADKSGKHWFVSEWAAEMTTENPDYDAYHPFGPWWGLFTVTHDLCADANDQNASLVTILIER